MPPDVGGGCGCDATMAQALAAVLASIGEEGRIPFVGPTRFLTTDARLIFDAVRKAVLADILDIGGAGDVNLMRDVARIARWESNDPAIHGVGILRPAGFGCFEFEGDLKEELTILAAAATDTAFTVPAGHVIVAVCVRVTTAIPAPATTFNVSLPDGTQLSTTTTIPVAAGSTDPGSNAGWHYCAIATKIRITPNANPGAATGKVRVIAFLRRYDPPTS